MDKRILNEHHEHNTDCDRMIMGITSELLYALRISIIYDNNRSKTVIVKEGDIARIVYIDVNEKREVTGRISTCIKDTLTIDYSEKYKSNKVEIDIQSIREIYLENEPAPLK